MCFTRKIIISGFFLLFGFYLAFPVTALPPRSFNELFPSLQRDRRQKAFSVDGYRRAFTRNESQSIIPGPLSGVNLFSVVAEKKPSHFIEALLVVPYNGAPFTLLEAYNALGKIGEIKNYSYFSSSRNANIHIFEDSSRIESDKKTRAIPDPRPSRTYPASEEVFVYLKDRHFGNLYVRGDLTTNQYGLTYSLTNFRAIRFLLIPIMKAEKFSAILYIEPCKEGMVVYGMAAIDVPDFLAARIDIASSIEIRLNALIDWLKQGLKR